MTVVPQPTSGGPRRGQQLPEARLLLCSAPGGALLVGAFDLAFSRGFASLACAAGFMLVAVGYALQAAITLRTPAWVDTWWAPAVTVCSALSSPLFGLFLVGARPSAGWFWLVGYVAMLTCYLCPPGRAALACGALAVVALTLMAPPGVPVGQAAPVVALGTVVDAVPAVVTALILGRIRRRERTVLLQTRHDPVTGVLNRRGLEHELDRLRDRLAPDAPVLIASVHLDGLDDAASWGGGGSDQLLNRVGTGLSRAYHRSHLVARFVDHEFVVVSELDPDLLVPSLLRAGRVATPDHPVSVSAGVVAGVPLRLLASGQLVPMLERARQLATRAQVAPQGMVREDLDQQSFVPIGVPTPVPAQPPPPDADATGPWSQAESRVLGWWLAATGVLVSAVPRHDSIPAPVLVAGCLSCLVVAGGGAWLARSPRPPRRLAEALVVLASPLGALAMTWVPAGWVRTPLLLLVTYPALMAGIFLQRRFARWVLALLPLGMVVATSVGTRPAPWRLEVAVSAAAFTVLTVGLAAYVRQRAGRALQTLHALTLTDPTTGVLTRAGLGRDFLDLPQTGSAGVLVASVLPRGGAGESMLFESDLVRVANALHELARGRGLVGRVGSRELAMAVPTTERMALLRRRLLTELAEDAPQVQVLVGLGRTSRHTEAGLWDAVEDAGSQIRWQRSGHLAGAHLVPAEAGDAGRGTNPHPSTL